MYNLNLAAHIIASDNNAGQLECVLGEFETRDEFEVRIVHPVFGNGDLADLWRTIKSIVAKSASAGEPYVLICGENHKFTKHYSVELLRNSIQWAETNDADILLGGAGSVHSVFSTTDSILWVEEYTDSHFLIIFQRFFQQILAKEIRGNETADYVVSTLTANKFLLFPFISGPGDLVSTGITEKENSKGGVTDLFWKTANEIDYILESEIFYGYNRNALSLPTQDPEWDDFSIPTFVINLPERTDRREHIVGQFAGREEFDITYISACKHEIGAVGLWQSMRKIIEIGIENEHDVIIICEDDHLFLDSYSRKALITHIIEAHEQGVDIMSGGTGGGFGYALPVATNRFWVNHFLSTQFIIIYSKFFHKILDFAFGPEDTADNVLSGLTSNKMVIYPFISRQRDFGYSDVTPMHNAVAGLTDDMFDRSAARLAVINSAYTLYGNAPVAFNRT